MTVSPFVTTSFNQKRPQDYIYHTPVYDNTDTNDDNVPDNPGNVLYYQENYSGNKDSLIDVPVTSTSLNSPGCNGSS